MFNMERAQGVKDAFLFASDGYSEVSKDEDEI